MLDRGSAPSPNLGGIKMDKLLLEEIYLGSRGIEMTLKELDDYFREKFEIKESIFDYDTLEMLEDACNRHTDCEFVYTKTHFDKIKKIGIHEDYSVCFNINELDRESVEESLVEVTSVEQV